MKLSSNYQVQQLLKQRSDLSTKLWAVQHSTEGRSFGISFNGTGEGGEERDIAAAALVPFYQSKIEDIDHQLRDLGVNPDE